MTPPLPKVVLSDTDPERLGDALADAWRRYTEFFGEPPHGTVKQMRALCCLLPPELLPKSPQPKGTVMEKPEPDQVAEKVSGIVSTECKDVSVEDYVEVLRACISTLETDIEAAQGG